MSSTRIRRQIDQTISATPLDVYQQELNSQATLRDYLITFIDTINTANINSIKLQASALLQLTQSTNQLTRSALVRSFALLSVTLSVFASRPSHHTNVCS